MQLLVTHSFWSIMETEQIGVSGKSGKIEGTDIWYIQNHRMAEFERDLWRSSGATFLLKQGYLKLLAQSQVQESSEYLQGRRLHNLPGQPLSVLSHSPSKKMFAAVQMTASVFQFSAHCAHSHYSKKHAHTGIFFKSTKWLQL